MYIIQMILLIPILDSPYYVFVALCIVVIVITDIQDGLFFVLTRARTFKTSYGQVCDSQQRNIHENIQYFHSRLLSLSVIPL
jgi:hypothetical protein